MGQYFDLLAERVREWDSGEGETEEFLITSALNSCECSVLVENACFGWLNMFNARHLGWPLPNVWLGVTVCNQAEADEKIPQLLQIPAAVRFVSVEPMLGPIDLNEWLGKWVCENASGSCGHFIYPSHKDCNSDCEEDCDGHCPHCGCDIAYDAPWQHETTLDWIICGGESGPGARPMHPDWPRKLRDDCVAAGVPYFFKQWGEWIHTPIWSSTKYLEARKVGKKAAGHLLDGQEWRQMPEVTR